MHLPRFLPLQPGGKVNYPVLSLLTILIASLEPDNSDYDIKRALIIVDKRKQLL